MSEQEKKPRGSRKERIAIIMAVMLTVAFAFATVCKAPVELFTAYTVGMAGLAGGFMWGNVKVHQAEKATT